MNLCLLDAGVHRLTPVDLPRGSATEISVATGSVVTTVNVRTVAIMVLALVLVMLVALVIIIIVYVSLW